MDEYAEEFYNDKKDKEKDDGLCTEPQKLDSL